MKTVKTRSELATILESVVSGQQSIGFIATMGALHEGHTSLVRKAKHENDHVVASIFVNPTQFNDSEDLTSYPRTPEADFNLLEEAGCKLLFCPTIDEIYDGNQMTLPHLGQMEKTMEGRFRPGHFRGVMEVVSRLFNCINPDKAYFGEKDYQQFAIIKAMAHQMGYKTEIIGCPTVRSSNGLALSSRNVLLTPDERHQAHIIYTSLLTSANTFKEKGALQAKEQYISDVEKTGLFMVEYIAITDSNSLLEADHYNPSGKYRALTAVKASTTRLIDNIAV